MIAAPHQELIEFVGSFYADVTKYIMAAYQWNEIGGPLSRFDGPEKWVLDVCDDISNQIAKNEFDGSHPVPVIYVGIASGNGCAKSAFAGMINNFIISTRPMSRVTVTANTGAQLKTKTWPEIKKWTNLSITKDWFEANAESIKHREHGDEWATNLVTWSLQNPSAFAGQHSREGSSVYIFDESARIPEAIYEEADGGLTDGEPFWIMLGNPTNRGGRLFRSVFGDLKNDFIHRSIDSRTCEHTNKEKIAKWQAERGEDSDWFRAHVKGEPPNAGDLQFIDNVRVQNARKRPAPAQDNSEPLRMSIDFARGGSASNVVAFRRGRDNKSIPATRIPGDQTRNTTVMVNVISELIHTHKPDIIMGDATGIGGPIMDRLRDLFPELLIIDVVNASPAADHRPNKPSRYGNMRAFCWGEMKEWLPGGAIEDHVDLEVDLTGPEFYHNKSDQLMLESKEDMEERDLASPDWGDALAMTFAVKHVEKRTQTPVVITPQRVIPARNGRGWMRR